MFQSVPKRTNFSQYKYTQSRGVGGGKPVKPYRGQAYGGALQGLHHRGGRGSCPLWDFNLEILLILLILNKLLIAKIASRF